MIAYDARFKAMAARMLAPKAQGGKGQVVTLTEPGSGGTYDEATDTTSGASAPVEHEGSGIEDLYSAFSLSSGLVEAADDKFWLSPVKTDGTDMPRPVADAWTLEKEDGSLWTVKKVDAIQPTGLGLVYALQLRGVG